MHVQNNSTGQGACARLDASVYTCQLSIRIGEVPMSNELIILAFLVVSVLTTVGGLVWLTDKNILK